MTIQQALQTVLTQLKESLIPLSDEQYNDKIEVLSNATIGQHVRHIVEMFVCLQEGFNQGIVNYENRERDIAIETSKETALNLIYLINGSLHAENKSLKLEAGFDDSSDELYIIPSNYYRELVYNLEHTIHHMALLKIGIRAVSNIKLPEGYGVASATIKHRKELINS